MRFRFFFLIDLGKLLRLAFLILLLLVATCSCSGLSARQASAARESAILYSYETYRQPFLQTAIRR